MLFVITLLALLALYMLPAMIAQKRRVASKPAIVLVNVLLGWTLLGWVACLIWAICERNEDHAEQYRRAARQFYRRPARATRHDEPFDEIRAP